MRSGANTPNGRGAWGADPGKGPNDQACASKADHNTLPH